MPSPSRETVIPVQRKAKSRIPSGRRIRRPPMLSRALTRSPDAQEELLDLGGVGGTRICLRPAALRGRFGDLPELVLRNAEMPKAAEAEELGELLDACDGVVASHRLAEAPDLLRGHLQIEPKRRGQADRI